MAAKKMSKAAAEARRAYHNAWNQANKDKVKAAQDRYWERKAAALKEQAANPDQEK